MAVHIAYPSTLPVSQRADDIRAALREHQVVIVAGATGSGKTTQLPKLAFEVRESLLTPAALDVVPEPRPKAESETTSEPQRGRQRRDATVPTLVGITQPRRLAATSVAARVAEELRCELGREVGYQIRFEDRTSQDTRLKFMTDGILLAELQSDPLLRRYHTLIIDEAHERGLTVDFLLGWLKLVLPRRPDLKLIVSSATIETHRFSEFFGRAPVIEVMGRTFPVDVLYEPPDQELDLADAVANSVSELAALDPEGDFLVFLPGEREISQAERALLAKNLHNTEILPLFARLSAADQNKVFGARTKRRVILATNVAETSLTIPGIVYVVDTGLARLARYEPRTGITRLQIERISQASANQRKGRAGRVREGICVRLYDEADFLARSGFTDPEIRRVGLAGVILRMKSLGLGEIETFPLLDAPDGRAVTEGYRVLSEIGALDSERQLTALGRRLARFPIDPRLSRMIIAGAEYDILDDILVLAAGLEIQDPRERPRGMEQKAEQAHRRFRDESSDFASLLKLWAFLDEARGRGTSQLRRACKENFLSFGRVREWREIHRQLRGAVKELGRALPTQPARQGRAMDRSARIHCALLSGIPSRIGQYLPEQRTYQGARQTRFVLHPASCLAKKPPAWVMAFELVETTRLFARSAAKVDPEWIAIAASHLLKRSYSAPHWSQKSARASVREHATLFGLPVLRDQSIDYATVEPGRARLMFLEHALVRGEYDTKEEFHAHNRALVTEVSRLRDKARRSDMLSDEETQLTFFDQRVPSNVVNGKTFQQWWSNAKRKTPTQLHLRMSDVLLQEESLEPADYPDTLELAGVKIGVSYRFDPRADDDGITLDVPLALLSRIDAGQLDWTIPGLHETRLLELLQRLPRSTRRELGVLPELAATLAAQVRPFERALIPAVTRAVRELTGITLPDDALRSDLLPGYLRPTCRILGDDGKVLATGRDLEALFSTHGAAAKRALASAQPTHDLRRSELQSWNFGELPTAILQHVAGSEVELYPALVDRSSSVELVLCPTQHEALTLSQHGVRRLLRLSHPRPFTALAKRIPNTLTPLQPATNPLGPSRAALQAFREVLLDRALMEACPLTADTLPRNPSDFEQLASDTLPHIESALSRVIAIVGPIGPELTRTQVALNAAARQPSGAAAVSDLRAQLLELFPEDLLQTVALQQLAHFPRYLQGMCVRLERAITSPPKDAAKLAPFEPLWQDVIARLTKQPTAELKALRWACEELRISIFAPELKTAFPVSLKKLKAALSVAQSPPHGGR